MISFLKPRNALEKNNSIKNRTADDINIDKLFAQDDKKIIAPQYDSDDILAVRIISDNGEQQEIEITYGKKKRRKITTNFVPKNLASDFYNNLNPSSANIGAMNFAALSPNKKDSALFQGKLLNSLAKVNFLTAYQKDNDIDYQKFWDGSSRIEINDRFCALNETQKEQAFELEAVRRKNYLTTAEKAILVAMVNSQRPHDDKVKRSIISQRYEEIEDKEAFKDFVYEILALIDNKNDLLQHFFPQAALDPALFECIQNIIFEPEFSKRQNKIKLVKAVIAHEKQYGKTK